MTENVLPHFSDPPLSEVAISVQFEPLEKLAVPEIGLLWQHYGSRFNHVEQHPPIEPVIERYGVRESESNFPNINIQLLTGGPPLPRIWFLSEDKTELLQIQQDRFIRNWRKVKKGDQYPRYDDHIRPKFLEDIKDFKEFLRDNNIGKIIPNQCEVTYTNILVSGSVWHSHSEIGKIFSFWASDYESFDDCEIENARFQIRQIIRDSSGEFVGRLYVSASPVYKGSEDTPCYSLTLVARGKPLSNDLDGIIGFVDLGREKIVKSFAKITDKKLHDLWGRQDLN